MAMKPRFYDVITIGGATEDIIFYTSEGVLLDNHQDLLRQRLLAFEYGAKIIINRSDSFFGGGAANASVCLSRLGLKTAALISVGKDERGRRIISNLKKEAVDTSSSHYVARESGFSFVVLNGQKDRIIFTDRAANDDLILSQRAQAKLKKTEWIYISSLSGAWKPIIKTAIVTGRKIAWNPGHVQLAAGIKVLKAYLSKIEVLILNKDEALELALSAPEAKSITPAKLDEIDFLLVFLKRFGPKIILITDGNKGAAAYDGERIYRHEPFKAKVIDTTGVGDAFDASFIAGLCLFGGDIARSMKLAMRNAAAKVSKLGAQTGLMRRSRIKS
jgi:ribokinase